MSTQTFPAEMRVDYVRVYQRRGETNIGCNPENYPTADYINRHMDVYKGEWLCYTGGHRWLTSCTPL